MTALSCQRDGVNCRSLKMSTASKLMPLLAAITDGMLNISMPSTNTVIATLMIAGRASGRLTVRTMVHVDAPATLAASSR